MNLLLINYEFPPLGAGASTATYHIGKELVAMGHEITILTSGYNKNVGYDANEGMTLFRCPAIRKKISESNILEMLSFVMSAFFFMPWVIKKHRIQGAIVFFSFPCGPLGLWAKMLFKIPYVISLRGGDVPGNEKKLNKIHAILSPLRKMIYEKSQAVIANSTGLKYLAQNADSFPISVIANGVDPFFFKPLNTNKEKKNFHFIFTGRLTGQKNLFFMLERFANLKKKSRKEFILQIVGNGLDKTKLKIFAEKLGLSKNIVWHGWVNKNKILKLYQAADCLVNPSFCEGMPNSVLEAMACGLPVIASDVPGNHDLVVDGENGFLFALDDYEKVETSLQMIIANPDLCSKFGKTARRKLIDKFSWYNTAKEYAKVINPQNQIKGTD